MENWQIPIKLIPAATDFMAKKHRKMMAGSRGIFHVFFPNDGYQFLGWMQKQCVNGWVETDGKFVVSFAMLCWGKNDGMLLQPQK